MAYYYMVWFCDNTMIFEDVQILDFNGLSSSIKVYVQSWNSIARFSTCQVSS